MDFSVERIEVWAGEVLDRPGELAQILETLARSGVDLECAVLRPDAPLSGTGVLFIAPVPTEEQRRTAKSVGLRPTRSQLTLRIAGPDRPGFLAHLARLVADAGLSICGVTSAGVAGRCIHYMRFESEAAAKRAEELFLARLG